MTAKVPLFHEVVSWEPFVPLVGALEFNALMACCVYSSMQLFAAAFSRPRLDTSSVLPPGHAYIFVASSALCARASTAIV